MRSVGVFVHTAVGVIFNLLKFSLMMETEFQFDFSSQSAKFSTQTARPRYSVSGYLHTFLFGS